MKGLDKEYNERIRYDETSNAIDMDPPKKMSNLTMSIAMEWIPHY